MFVVECDAFYPCLELFLLVVHALLCAMTFLSIKSFFGGLVAAFNAFFRRSSLPVSLGALKFFVVHYGSLSRQGLQSQFYRAEVPHKHRGRIVRLLGTVLSSFFIGSGVSLFISSGLGVAPGDVFVSGLTNVLPFSFGQTVWIFNGCLYLIAAFLGHPPRLATLGWSFMNGFFVDAVSSSFVGPSSLVGSWVYVVLGSCLISSAVALFSVLNESGGSFELLAQAASERGLPAGVFRTMLELSLIAGGFFLGGNIGAGTIVFAVSVSFLLSFFQSVVLDHRLGRRLRVAPHSADLARIHSGSRDDVAQALVGFEYALSSD